MTIGEKIKVLRQKNDVTQEKLAEYLNITYQSVSKWENNNALPDISYVVPIANFFGVSIDELFDRDGETESEEVDEYFEKDRVLANQGKVEESLAMWREAVQKYPRNYRCLSQLSHYLHSTLHIGYSWEEKEKNAQEAAAICERILRDCTDQDVRDSAIQTLVYLYGNPRLSFADEEKAEKYALMASSFYGCRELLLEHAYFYNTEEGQRKGLGVCQHNTLRYMQQLFMNLCYVSYRSVEEHIFACETAIKMWDALIYDGNYLCYHYSVGCAHELLARDYAELKKREKVLEHLEKAFYHAQSHDRLPEGETHFSCLFLSEATSDPSQSTKNYDCSFSELIRRHTDRSCFDFLREDETFLALLR